MGRYGFSTGAGIYDVCRQDRRIDWDTIGRSGQIWDWELVVLCFSYELFQPEMSDVVLPGQKAAVSADAQPQAGSNMSAVGACE